MTQSNLPINASVLFEIIRKAFDELYRVFDNSLSALRLTLAMLLLKRLNEVFAEQRERVIQSELQQRKSRDEALLTAEDQDEYRFYLPPTARWQIFENREVTATSAYKTVTATLEYHSPRLFYRLFLDLPGGEADVEETLENVLRLLIAQFDELKLGDTTLAYPTAPAEAAELLIASVCEQGGHSWANDIAPPAWIHLLAELLQPQAGMRLYDPLCGDGAVLTACRRFLEQRGRSTVNLSIFGQEPVEELSAICRTRLLLFQLSDFRIVTENTLANPVVTPDGSPMRFDLIVSNLVRSNLRTDSRSDAASGAQRLIAQPESAQRPEVILIERIAACLDERGRAAVIVPQGFLFRSGVEMDVRAKLLAKDADLVEAVISLPEENLSPAGIVSSILILNRDKSLERQGKVLFIDGGTVCQTRSATPQVGQRGESPVVAKAGDSSTSVSAPIAGTETGLTVANILAIAALYRGAKNRSELQKQSQRLVAEFQQGVEHRKQLSSPPSTDSKSTTNLSGLDVWRVLDGFSAIAASLNDRFEQDHNIESLVATATLEALAANDYNLHAAHYFQARKFMTDTEIRLELQKVKELERLQQAEEKQFAALLENLGYTEASKNSIVQTG